MRESLEKLGTKIASPQADRICSKSRRPRKKYTQTSSTPPPLTVPVARPSWPAILRIPRAWSSWRITTSDSKSVDTDQEASFMTAANPVQLIQPLTSNQCSAFDCYSKKKRTGSGEKSAKREKISDEKNVSDCDSDTCHPSPLTIDSTGSRGPQPGILTAPT